MGNQESQKRGLRSESQKEEKARDAYAPVPPSNLVRGAFGGSKRNKSWNDERYTSARETRKSKK
jgi:hypothetical protein